MSCTGKNKCVRTKLKFVHHNLCKVKEKLRVTETIQISFRLLSRDRSSWLKNNSVVWIWLKVNPLPKGILLLRNTYHIEVDCAMSGPSPSSFRGVWTAVEVDAIEMSGCKSRNSLRSPNKKDDKATNIGRFEIKTVLKRPVRFGSYRTFGLNARRERVHNQIWRP